MRATAVILSLGLLASGCAKTSPVMDTSAGISSVCPVHHVQMERREVVVSTGVPGPFRRLAEMAKLAGSSEAFRKEEKERFPFSKAELWAGDEIDSSTPRTGFVYLCSDCVNAFAIWRAQKAANPESSVTRSRHMTLVEQARGEPETKAQPTKD